MFKKIREVYRKVLPESFRKSIRSIRNRLRVYIYKAEMLIFHKQAIYYCPCCNTKLHRFISGVYMNRPEIFQYSRYINIKQDVICPICGALPRHRILAAWCNDNKDMLKGKILYFALENGMKQWFTRNSVTYVSADLFNNADLS